MHLLVKSIKYTLAILIDENSNRENLGIFKILRDTSRAKIKPGSQELNPSV